MYYRNDSDMTIKQTLGLENFEGIEVYRKATAKNDKDEKEYVHTLKPGQEDLIFLKRTTGACSYSVGLGIEMTKEE